MSKPKTSLRLSASQIDTATLCLRKWWLSKVAKAPHPFDKKMLLGEVGHGASENYLNRVPLYPEGWTSPTNRFTGKKSEHHITVTEQALVKALINFAIKEGILLVQPDGEVEKEFGTDMGVVDTVEGIKIRMTGFIDYFYGNHVEDHKFIGPNSGKYYGKKKLEGATAMNLYAWAGYEEGFITDPSVWLRYNLFKKDIHNPSVNVVEVERSKEQIYEFFEQNIRPQFRRIALAVKNCDSWEKVESAMCVGKAAQACQAYGGCEYLDICSGRATLDEYKARFEELSLEDKKKSQQGILDQLLNNNTEGKGKKMSGFLKKTTQAGMAADAKEAAPKQATAQVQSEPVKQEAPAQQKAPWYYEGPPPCIACKTTKPAVLGLNANNEPCQICTMQAVDAFENGNPDQPLPDDYIIDVQDDGTVTFTKKGEPEPAIETQPVEQEPTTKEQVQSLSGDEFADEFSDELPSDEIPEEAEPSVPEVSHATPSNLKTNAPMEFDYVQKKSGKKGLKLSYAPIRTRSKASKVGAEGCVLLASEILVGVQDTLLDIANHAGERASNWYSVNAFKRRDIIALNAEAIADHIGDSWVDASGILKASDEHVLCSHIERFADKIIGEMM